MSTVKISALTEKATMVGTEEVLINDSGTSKKFSTQRFLDVKTDCETAETNASASAVAAASSAASAASVYDSFDDRYLGNKTANPTLDNDGDALVSGALYFNTTDGNMMVYDGSAWITTSSAVLSTLVLYKFTATASQTVFTGTDDDGGTLSIKPTAEMVTLNGIVLESGADYTVTTTTLTLLTGATVSDEVNVYAFGNFELADHYSKTASDARFLGLAGGAMTGAITTNSTFDGRDVATDGSKLDGIEASADVTDTTNVTAAGALMDSEVTNLAAVKAFDTTDYATSTQGTTADNALPLAGGTMTGTIATFTSTGIDDNATSTAITIDASENVGINETAVDTTNSTKLEVKSSAASVTSAIRTANKDVTSGTAQGASLDFGLSRNTGTYKPEAGKITVGRDADWTSANANIDAYMSFSSYTANTLTEKMRIDSAGNVGIGTSAPDSLLEVSGADESQIKMTGASGVEAVMRASATTATIGTNTAHNLYLRTNNSARMTILSTGNVGIGTTSPSEKLYVSGNIYATGNVTAYSDERIKKNINEIPNALDAVDAIRGVSYTRTDTEEDSIGVIAQEVEALFPELIAENNEGMKSVNYNGLIGVLFSAVKELSAKVKELEAK